MSPFFTQGPEFQQRLLDVVVLVLLSAAGPDVADNLASAAKASRTEVTWTILQNKQCVIQPSLFLFAARFAAAAACEFMKSVIAAPQEALDRAATVPIALRALTIGLLPVSANVHMQQRHWHILSNNLLLQPRSVVFVDAVFDAIRTIYRMVRSRPAIVSERTLLYILICKALTCV